MTIDGDNIHQDELSKILSVPSLMNDMVQTLCGKHIGEGSSRSVYEYNLDPRFVIKLEGLCSNCNLVEHMMWDEIQGLKGELEWVKDWFAPVEWISPNGRILVMRRTNPESKLKRPEKIPAFLWDVCSRNFGWIGKNYVCHDYGQFYNLIEYSRKFKKIDWD